ncbi:MAG: response regulator transcription factor [Verrucomicrobiales bacterium]
MSHAIAGTAQAFSASTLRGFYASSDGMTSPKTEATITVWLIEDNATYRKTVSRVIEGTGDMCCSGAFSCCEEALSAITTGDAPSVVLIDVGLPGMDGIQGIREIKIVAPNTLIIVLTVFDDQEKVFRAICAGASGYLLKASPIDAITEGIRKVMQGEAPMNGRIATMVLTMFSKLAPSEQNRQTECSADYGLTEREREILQLMVDGLIKKEIAHRLSVSFHTVDTHLRNIYMKLQVNTQTSAVVKAVREGLVD